MNFTDLIYRIQRKLGYVRPTPAHHSPQPNRLPLGLSHATVGPHLAPVLAGQEVPWDRHAHPAGVRGWFEDRSKPRGVDERVGLEWDRLLAAGDRADLVYWLDAWRQQDVPGTITERLVRFQINETVLQSGDACPASWGPLGVQSVVAFYNLCFLAEHRKQGIAGAQPALRKLLEDWLSQAPSLAAPRSGDLVLLDLLYQDLGTQLAALEGAARSLSWNLEQAESAECKARAAHERLWWPGLVPQRQEAGKTWVKAYEHQERLRAALAALEAGIRDLTQLREAWRRLSPVTVIRESAASQPFAEIPSPAPSASPAGTEDWQSHPASLSETATAPVSLLVIATDPTARGLQQWLAARMAEACSLSHLEWHPLPDPVQELLGAAAARSGQRDEETWRLRHFLLLFFFHWSRRADRLEAIRDRYPTCPEAMRPAMLELLGTWRRLRQEVAELAGQPRTPAEWGAYRELKLLTSPLTTDQWEQREVPSQAMRLDILQEHLLRVKAA